MNTFNSACEFQEMQKAIIEHEVDLPTPFYLYDSRIINARYHALRSALPQEIDIVYSVKANPNISIVRHLYALGCGIEIASDGELLAALEVGVAPEKIVFAGPAKTDSELQLAVAHGIRAVNVESRGELLRLETICEKLGKPIHAHIRVNTLFEITDSAVQMSGGARKFGIDEEELSALMPLLRSLRFVRIDGFHVFSATQVLDAAVYERYLSHCAELVERFAAQMPRVPCSIDIGSGLGIPYGENEQAIDLSVFGEHASEFITRLKRIDPAIRCIFETGRFLVGEAGMYVTEVTDVKVSRGKTFVLCDGGINHCVRPALIGCVHPIAVLQTDTCEKVPVTVGGPLCTSLDVFAEDMLLPPVTSGDRVAVLNTGAYGYTESMPYFLSHRMPDEYCIDKDGIIRKIRQGRTVRDIINEQKCISL